MNFLNTIGTIARGVNAANDEADRLRDEELKRADAALKALDARRGVAKERYAFDRGEAQQAIKQNDYAGADTILRGAQADRNTYLGRNEVAPTLIGTPTGATIERARPTPSFQGPMPGVPEIDESRPDYNNPANRLTIDRRAGYTPPKTEYKAYNPGDQVYAFDGETGARKSGQPEFTIPNKPTAAPKPRYVRRDNGDGTYSMVEMVPGEPIPYKPAATKYVKESDVWATVDKRLASKKPIPNADRTVDLRTGKPLTEALADYDAMRAQDFEEEYRLQVEQNPSTGRANPFSAPPSFNQPSRGGFRPRGVVGTGGTARWAPIVKQASEQFGVPAEIITAVMRQESGGNPNARSPVGALGLMQFMPGTAKGLGIDPLNPEQAILGGAKHLKGLYAKFGKWSDAIAAYNAGADASPARPGKRVGPFAPSASDPRYRVWENPANAGYAETRNYVKSIKADLKRQGIEISAAEAEQVAGLLDKYGLAPGATNA